MRLYLSGTCALKRLECPSAYRIDTDELYELDEEAFRVLSDCSRPEGCEARGSEFTEFCLAEGILSGQRTEARRPPVEKSPVPSLRYLELQITRNCNLRCRHCYIGPPRNEELSVAEVGRVLGEFERMQGLRVLLTGGEPLMHSAFGGINDLLPRYAVRTIIFTNGVLMTGKRLRTLNAHEIQVSVDGMEKGHEALRGKGTYRKAMDCVRNALDAGFPASVSTMVHAENLDEFDLMEETFTRMGIKEWTVDVPCVTGSLAENPSLRLPPGVAGKYLGYGFGEGLHGGGEGFACGLHLMSVTADGGCAKCAFYSERPVGHIREGLAACWSRIKPVGLEALECDCPERALCRGGCRYRAELSGSPLGKDLYRCAYYGKL